VEVAGIGPASLSNQIKVATCLVYLLSLIRETSLNRIFQDAAFFALALCFKAKTESQPKLRLNSNP